MSNVSTNINFQIPTGSVGFFRGYNPDVARLSLFFVAVMTTFILMFPSTSSELLMDTRVRLIEVFRGWYMYALFGFFLVGMIMIITPGTGDLKLARDGEGPEFSTFSWLSMMFCTGIGIGIVVFSINEPLNHLQTNPDILMGEVTSNTAEAVPTALKYTYLHWGVSAWACYSVLGLGISFFSYRHGTPLTIRAALTPLLSSRFGGGIGNAVDIFSVFAIIAGVGTSMGLAVPQFVIGLYYTLGIEIAEDNVTTVSVITALCVVAGFATLAIVSGVNKGIKWVSNFSIILFLSLLVIFAVFGAPALATKAFGTAVASYVTDYVNMSTFVASDTTSETSRTLGDWQAKWTIFYWAWWIGFAPFVGMFLARVSKGRSVREFVIGSMLGPCGICMAWFAYVGGTAISFELSGDLAKSLNETAQPAQLYATAYLMFDGPMGDVLAIAICALTFMLISTTFIAGVLAINTIAAAGDDGPKPASHIILWSLAVTLIIAGLIIAGGITSIRDALIISALPFSIIIALAAVSVVFMIMAEKTVLVRVRQVS